MSVPDALRELTEIADRLAHERNPRTVTFAYVQAAASSATLMALTEYLCAHGACDRKELDRMIEKHLRDLLAKLKGSSIVLPQAAN